MSLKELTLNTTPIQICYSENTVISEDLTCFGIANLNFVNIDSVTDGYLKTVSNGVTSVQQIPYSDISGTGGVVNNPLTGDLNANNKNITNIDNCDVNTLTLNSIDLNTRLNTDENYINSLLTKTQYQSVPSANNTNFTGTVYTDTINNTNTIITSAINNVNGFSLQYGGNNKVLISSTGASINGTLFCQPINFTTGPQLQHNGNTKLSITSTGCTATGRITTDDLTVNNLISQNQISNLTTNVNSFNDNKIQSILNTNYYNNLTYATTSFAYFPNGRIVMSGSSNLGSKYTDDGGNTFISCIGLPQFSMPSDYVDSLGFSLAMTYLGGTTCYKSTDGITWTVHASGLFTLPYFGCKLIYSGGNWITNDGTNMRYSTDGITWSVGSAFIAGSIQNLGSGRLVSSYPNTNYPIYSSNHGVNWSLCSGCSIYSQAIAGNGSKVLIPYDTDLYYSNNYGQTYNVLSNYISKGSGVYYSAGEYIQELGMYIFSGKHLTSGIVYLFGCVDENSGFIEFNTGFTYTTNNGVYIWAQAYIRQLKSFLLSGNGPGTIMTNQLNLSRNFNPINCNNERRICTSLNSGTSKTLIANTEQQLSGATTQLMSGLNFSINTSTGVITYTGNTANFIITLTHGGSPGNNQANNSMSVYIKKNTTIIPTYARGSLGNALIPIGGSSTLFTSLTTNDTLTAFVIATVGYTHTFTEMIITIRQLYN